MKVSQRITRVTPTKKLWIVADQYPVWLVAAVALRLPIERVQAPEDFKEEFPEVSAVWHGLGGGLTASPSADTLVLGSGSQSFLQSVCAKLRHHKGGKILSLFSLTGRDETTRSARPFAASSRGARRAAIPIGRYLLGKQRRPSDEGCVPRRLWWSHGRASSHSLRPFCRAQIDHRGNYDRIGPPLAPPKGATRFAVGYNMGTSVCSRHIDLYEPLGEQWWGVGQAREGVGRLNRPPKGGHGPKDSV
ncbi:hypothetical protein THAOC_12045 [Thalassiosira oceanica]|uniref:Uncharacterized protein n=1 Tax=Thalassiosira oceanica TaxID=159749 RepID=K0T8W5_THAOC|nr:hypothetical protein THAOC_12045 [Thalassiosira oceanica]|eukprot:EJK66977.1 hypothetical protein THAOC_12045 [Thalassiosira oceanica]